MAEVDFEDAIKRAKEAFPETVEWKENAGCLFIQKDGTFRDVYNNVCHANLRSGRGSKFVINGLMIGTNYGSNPGRILSAEIEHWFVDYILNRSAYSAIFHEKDAKRALEERMVVASGDHPGNLVGAGLVALRSLWEMVHRAQASYDLVKLGVNEDLAFFLAHLIQTKNNAGPHDAASWTGCTSGHCSMNPSYFKFKDLRNFLEHKVISPNRNYADGGEYSSYDGMYGGDYGGDVVSYIRNNFPKHLYKDDKPAPVSLNPFTAALPKPEVGKADSAPYAKAIEVMAQWAKTHLMEKIYA